MVGPLCWALLTLAGTLAAVSMDCGPGRVRDLDGSCVTKVFHQRIMICWEH